MWILGIMLLGTSLIHGKNWKYTAGDQLPMFRMEHKVHKMWLLFLTLSIWSSKTEGSQQLTASNQLPDYKMKTEGLISNMTVANGEPIELKDTEAVNYDELVNNNYLVQNLQGLNRERIPERTVHAKGGGAFGYFEVTHDISDICKAKVFTSVGKKTPIAVRFSSFANSKGGPDTNRDNRGFSVKFYTEEGNLDLLGVPFEYFFVKDPLYFANFVHAFKKNPKTMVYDVNARWDFLTLRQETINFVVSLFRDMGIPKGYRHMPGYTIHTYQVYNNKGESHYIRFRFEPEAGLQSLDTATATRIAGEDPDYANRDLYEAILNGDFPSWIVAIQHMSPQEIKQAEFNPFDVTMKWPVQKYPPKPIGKIVLNENPSNYFADIEQLSFIPSNLVPGILGGVDKLFESRRWSYADAAVYRLGVNYNRILVNCPFDSDLKTYYRDGAAPVGNNFKDIPNYYPNSFNGPMPYSDQDRPALIRPYVDPQPTNFRQASDTYEKEMKEDERRRFITNLVTSLSGAADFIQHRAVKWFTAVNPDFGERVANGLKNATLC